MTSAARRSLAVLALAASALVAACANLDEGTTPRCSDTDPPTSTNESDTCFTKIIPAPGSEGTAGSGGGGGAAGASGGSGEAGSSSGAAGSGGESGESGAGGSG